MRRGAIIEDAGRDAIRMAFALNQYERSGFRNGRDASPTPTNSLRDDRSVSGRGLWSELVETYGAESVDLEGFGSGTCCITLSNGDLVFYVPEYRKWLWLAFERTLAEPRAVPVAPVASGGDSATLTNRGPSVHTPARERMDSHARTATHRESSPNRKHVTRAASKRPKAIAPTDPNPITVAGMTQVLSSQNTPAAYEEALFVTEGLLLGATYGKRVVPYEELAWVVEAATGHSLNLQSMGRFIGDLVERSYPRHMEVLSALAVPAPAPSEPALETWPAPESGLPHTANTDGSAGEASVVDLTGSGMSPTSQNVAGRPS